MAETILETERKLIAAAAEALKNAYAPYSSFRVGAALCTDAGKIYTGCNVENSSLGLSMCAERNAFFKAISEGESRFSKLALVTETPGPVFPCGACRQVMAEFSPDLLLLITNTVNQDIVFKKLGELIPNAFGPADLRNKPEKG